MSKCNLCAFIICRSQMHLQGLSSNWRLFQDATSEFRMIEQKHLSKKMCISPKCLKRLLASTAALATISPPAGWFSLLHPSPRFPLKIDSYDSYNCLSERVWKQTSSSSSAALWRMFEGLACWAKSSLEDIWRTCLSKELPHPLISELHQERTTAAAASRFLLLLLTNSVSSRKQDDHDKGEEREDKKIVRL